MYRMMIVDDDSFVLDGLKNEIDWESLHIQIAVSCSNGTEALQILEKEQIDILLTDVKMPGMNGLELTKEALGRRPELKIVIISGYGEFEYAQQAIKCGVFDYLLKPVSVDMIRSVFQRLVGKLDESRADQSEREELLTPILNQKIYYDILFGIHNGQTEREVQRQKKFSRFQAAAVRIDIRSAEDTLKLENTVKQIFELLQQRKERLNYVPLLMGNEEIFILFSLYLNEEQSLVEDFLRRFQEEVSAVLGITVSVGLSGCFKDLWSSSQNYRNAGLAVERRFYLGYNQIIHFDRLKIPSNIDITLLVQSRSVLLEGLENWDYKSVISELEVLEEVLRQKIQLNMDQVRRIGIELYSMLQSVHNHRNPLTDSECEMYSRVGSKMNEAGTFEELFDILKNLYTDVLSREEGKSGKSHRAVEQAIEYVKNNINTNISLAKVAQKVYLSPNYLGKIFKEEMHMGFNEYLETYRMETAKKLLKSGRYKVYEVSSMVGYRNPNYFSKVFTEYTNGISPSDYTG